MISAGHSAGRRCGRDKNVILEDALLSVVDKDDPLWLRLVVMPRVVLGILAFGLLVFYTHFLGDVRGKIATRRTYWTGFAALIAAVASSFFWVGSAEPDAGGIWQTVSLAGMLVSGVCAWIVWRYGL